LGSIWYWRNLILTGNPIFPAEVAIGDWVIFQGYTGLTERIQELSLWNRFTEGDQSSEWFAAMTKETGWHLYLVIFAYVLLVVETIYKMLFSKMQRGGGKDLYLDVVLPAGLLVSLLHRSLYGQHDGT